jgi:galactose mutarotase-like enzyme
MGTQTRVTTFDGERAHLLRAADGTEVWVLPSIGANCIAMRVPLPDGAGTAHVLATPPSAAALRGHPTGSGYPILSPHPSGGRLPLTWRDGTYAPPDRRDRLAGHGFAAGAAWKVLDATAESLVCELDSRTLDPATAWWPWPFTITATFRLAPAALTSSFELHGHHDGPAPVQFGLHPYFPLRMVPPAGRRPDGDAGAVPPPAAELVGGAEAAARRSCRVWVEADELWDLDRRREGWAPPELRDRWALRRPRSLADLAETAQRTGVATREGRMPVLFYGLPEALTSAGAGGDGAAPGGIAGGVVDTAAGLAVRLETSFAFGGIAVYTPPNHPAVSLEPRATLLDALALSAAQPALATGLRAVEPGRPWRAWARLSVAPAAGEGA